MKGQWHVIFSTGRGRKKKNPWGSRKFANSHCLCLQRSPPTTAPTQAPPLSRSLIFKARHTPHHLKTCTPKTQTLTRTHLTRARIHTHTHTHTHTHKHTHTHTLSLSLSLTHTHTYTRTHTLSLPPPPPSSPPLSL